MRETEIDIMSAGRFEKMIEYLLTLRDQCALVEQKNTVGLDEDIMELDLSVRTYYCLKKAGIRTVADLYKKSVYDLMQIRNLGRKSLEEVVGTLSEYGLPVIGFEQLAEVKDELLKLRKMEEEGAISQEERVRFILQMKKLMNEGSH